MCWQYLGTISSIWTATTSMYQRNILSICTSADSSCENHKNPCKNTHKHSKLLSNLRPVLCFGRFRLFVVLCRRITFGIREIVRHFLVQKIFVVRVSVRHLRVDVRHEVLLRVKEIYTPYPNMQLYSGFALIKNLQIPLFLAPGLWFFDWLFDGLCRRGAGDRQAERKQPTKTYHMHIHRYHSLYVATRKYHSNRRLLQRKQNFDDFSDADFYRHLIFFDQVDRDCVKGEVVREDSDPEKWKTYK